MPWLDLLDVRLKEDAALSKLYDVKGPITRGAQSGCTLVIHKETGVHYAMRVYANEELSEWKLDELTAAVAAQRKLNDAAEDEDLRSLSRLHEVLGSPKRTLVISELTPTDGTLDLFSLIDQRGRLAEQDARQIFTRLVLAVKAAHQAGVVLRNLKPELLQVRRSDSPPPCAPPPKRRPPARPPACRVAPSARHAPCPRPQVRRGTGAKPWGVWVADLHCAAPVSEGQEEACLRGLHGTPEYCAPEVVIWYWHECTPPQLPEPPPPYGVQADAWALGICLHVMLCGCFPFTQDEDEDELLRTINAADFSFSDPGWKKVSEDALDLVISPFPRPRPLGGRPAPPPLCRPPPRPRSILTRPAPPPPARPRRRPSPSPPACGR
jgi:serine/threonine protein kinase